MWSNQYLYYNIYSDDSFSEEKETTEIIKILLHTNCLKQVDHQTFSNTETFPWINIAFFKTTNGNYASSDRTFEKANLITIVCSKNDNKEIYANLLLQIANELHWNLVLEEDDLGNENIVINGSV